VSQRSRVKKKTAGVVCHAYVTVQLTGALTQMGYNMSFHLQSQGVADKPRHAATSMAQFLNCSTAFCTSVKTTSCRSFPRGAEQIKRYSYNTVWNVVTILIHGRDERDLRDKNRSSRFTSRLATGVRLWVI